MISIYTKLTSGDALHFLIDNAETLGIEIRQVDELSSERMYPDRIILKENDNKSYLNNIELENPINLMQIAIILKNVLMQEAIIRSKNKRQDRFDKDNMELEFEGDKKDNLFISEIRNDISKKINKKITKTYLGFLLSPSPIKEYKYVKYLEGGRIENPNLSETDSKKKVTDKILKEIKQDAIFLSKADKRLEQLNKSISEVEIDETGEMSDAGFNVSNIFKKYKSKNEKK